MVRILGKGLQVAGLLILPLAMAMQLTAGLRAPTGGGITVSTMLLMLVGGVCLFTIGRYLEGLGRA